SAPATTGQPRRDDFSTTQPPSQPAHPGRSAGRVPWSTFRGPDHRYRGEEGSGPPPSPDPEREPDRGQAGGLTAGTGTGPDRRRQSPASAIHSVTPTGTYTKAPTSRPHQNRGLATPAPIPAPVYRATYQSTGR